MKELKSDIKKRIEISDNWEQIQIHFEKVYPEFISRLKNDCQNITLNEIKLCVFTKLQFSSKEISLLLNIIPESVQMLRYRLKKKINIPPEANFIDFINA